LFLVLADSKNKNKAKSKKGKNLNSKSFVKSNVEEFKIQKDIN